MTNITKRVFARHIRSLRGTLEKHEITASALVGTVLFGCCAAAYPSLKPAELPVELELLDELSVKAFIHMLEGQPFLEAAYWLSSAYAMLVCDTHRKSLAMFFTPPSLTGRLLDDLEAQGVRFDQGSFFDPACGGAAFLAPIALRMKTALIKKGYSSEQILLHVESHLFGTDIDKTLCSLSNHFLKMALYDEIRSLCREPKFRVSNANSLCDVDSLFGVIDVLVCNPPYRKMRTDEVKLHRTNFEEVIEFQPNIYGLFIALSVKLLKKDGICALVTPTSFLSGQNFSKLRSFLMAETQVLQVGMVSDRSGVFIDVEQETALTLLRRGANSFDTPPSASVSVVSRDGNYINVGRCVLPISGAAWPIPRAEADVLLLEKATPSEFRLKDYGYRVRIGTFVWNRDKRPVYMSADSVSPREARSAVPLLWSSDIKPNGVLHFDGLRKANLEPCFVNLGSKEHISVIRRPSVLLQRVTSNDQPRRLVAAAVSQELLDTYGGFVGENHTVILEQTTASSLLPPHHMARLLGCPVVDRYYRCISGATNVSVFELNQLSLPDPSELKRHLDDGYSVEDAANLVVFGPRLKSFYKLEEMKDCS